MAAAIPGNASAAGLMPFHGNGAAELQRAVAKTGLHEQPLPEMKSHVQQAPGPCRSPLADRS
jgi:hypothetical protein